MSYFFELTVLVVLCFNIELMPCENSQLALEHINDISQRTLHLPFHSHLHWLWFFLTFFLIFLVFLPSVSQFSRPLNKSYLSLSIIVMVQLILFLHFGHSSYMHSLLAGSEHIELAMTSRSVVARSLSGWNFWILDLMVAFHRVCCFSWLCSSVEPLSNISASASAPFHWWANSVVNPVFLLFFHLSLSFCKFAALLTGSASLRALYCRCLSAAETFISTYLQQLNI